MASFRPAAEEQAPAPEKVVVLLLKKRRGLVSGRPRRAQEKVH